MSDSSSDSEPTMEEILASIRKIISEDEPPEGEGAGDAEAGPADAATAAEEDDDEDDEAPLDLTQMVDEDGNVVDLEAQREAPAEPPTEPDGEVDPESDAEEEFELEAVEPDPEPAGPPQSPPSPPAIDGLEALVAAETATSATSAMSRLSDVLESNGEGDTVAIGADMTLVELVRETLKPHLKAWLDAHLPDLVERIVREEIKKMIKRAEYR